MRLVPSVLQGAFCSRDLLDAALPNKHVPALTEAEGSPLERLVLEAADHNLVVADFRDLRAYPRRQKYETSVWGWPADKSAAHPYGSRPWNKLTAVCLHTFAVSGMGSHRFLGVPTHCGLAHDGTPVLCHDLTRLVAHGNGANRFSAGIEISGVSGFDSPMQVTMGRALIRYIADERARNLPGAQPMAVMGHFMARKAKPVCPGAAIMRELGEWAIDELGLKPQPSLPGGLPWKREAKVA